MEAVEWCVTNGPESGNCISNLAGAARKGVTGRWSGGFETVDVL